MSFEKYKTDYQTPPDVAAYMASLIPKFAKHILEPTPGVGNLLKAIYNAGYAPHAPFNYFDIRAQRWDAIVSNPPFSKKFTNLENAPEKFMVEGMKVGYQFLYDFMELTDNIIILLPWFVITDSDVRLRGLKRWGLKSITSLPRKTFQYSRIQCVVLEMEKGWKRGTEFLVFDTIDDFKKQTLF